MKSLIVYVPGWGSSPNSETANKIKAAFPNETFMCPIVNHHDTSPKVTQAQMDALGKSLMNRHDAVIVGSSAGGFWADYVGSVYGIKTVLINPSLHPSSNFKKYNLPDLFYKEYAEIEKFVKSHHRHHMVAFAGDKDDVVPMKLVKTHYKNPVVLKDEGHRLKDLSPVVKMIQAMIGNNPEHQ